MSDPSQSEQEAMEAAKRTPPKGARGFAATQSGLLAGLNYERGVEAGWHAHREWSRSPEAVERAARAVSDMLAEFHATVAHPDTDVLWTRDTLVTEEAAELSVALRELDFTLKAGRSDTARWAAEKAVARELADVVYVAYGTAHALGIRLDVAVAAVHEANMLKADGPRRADGKVLKPEGWTPPDVSAALDATSEKEKPDGQ